MMITVKVISNLGGSVSDRMKLRELYDSTKTRYSRLKVEDDDMARKRICGMIDRGVVQNNHALGGENKGNGLISCIRQPGIGSVINNEYLAIKG
ncbi:unnamed protein product [Ilex paraguariensis]|uniref:Uncharacterized protein n=1 Tax=Ilex paraguariensis TaxID=185542 RepID=A0ABC8RU91_9AQUA